jgi:hypothetical protein
MHLWIVRSACVNELFLVQLFRVFSDFADFARLRPPLLEIYVHIWRREPRTDSAPAVWPPRPGRHCGCATDRDSRSYVHVRPARASSRGPRVLPSSALAVQNRAKLACRRSCTSGHAQQLAAPRPSARGPIIFLNRSEYLISTSKFKFLTFF